MAVEIWDSLVAEAQFATELAVTGLRRLCSVPTEPGLGGRRSNDRNFSLHVGMYSYSSGLERLCKLAIACNEFAASGEFPKLIKYNHKIGKLLDAVEALTPAGPGTKSMHKAKYLGRPKDDLDSDLIGMVERFANGAGRYEYLDSLWRDNPEVITFHEWSALAARLPASEEVGDLIALKDAMAYAIEAELAEAGLPASSERVREDLALPTYMPSVGVALKLYQKIRWVSAILDVATYYTRPGLPILGEVVSPTLTQSTLNFFRYEIARISDEEVVTDELEEVYKRIQKREAEDDEEY